MNVKLFENAQNRMLTLLDDIEVRRFITYSFPYLTPESKNKCRHIFCPEKGIVLLGFFCTVERFFRDLVIREWNLFQSKTKFMSRLANSLNRDG